MNLSNPLAPQPKITFAHDKSVPNGRELFQASLV